MKKFFRSFYGKLSLVFLLLLLLTGAAQLYITVESWTQYYHEADQKLNQRLARDLVPDFKPLVGDTLNMPEIEHMMHYLMVMNPKIEIYLLDSKGGIMAFFADPGKEVKLESLELEPIQRFISEQGQTPILAVDPRNPKRHKPFSAAPIDIGDERGYLFVIIGSQDYDTAIAALEDSYLGTALLKGLVIVLIFTGVLGLFLFAFLTRRVRVMNDMVKSFEKGEYDKRIPVHSNDELGSLAQTINTMAAKIEANIHTLQETDRLRRELIANVSHDLRSPLASIRGYLETMQIRNGQLSEEERARYIDSALETASGLENLVEQLFELSKMDACQVRAEKEPFILGDLLYDVARKYEPQLENKNLRMKVTVEEGLPQAHADIALMERVLSNLLDNAIRYTPAGGEIKLKAAQSDDTLKVTVEDTGEGIGEDDQKRIFDRFYRAEKSRSAATGGAGLGLSIVKKIMDLHDSDIYVQSAKGKGTSFTFEVHAYKPVREKQLAS